MSTRSRTVVVGTLVLTSALAASPSRVLAQSPGGADVALSPPALVLTVAPATGGGPWTLKVENTGEVPIRVAADPHLLILEVTPPAGFVDEAAKAKAKATRRRYEAPKSARCVLPADTRPRTDGLHELVVPGKRSWSSTIDPLFYCFGPRERAMLVSGASVKATFGWPAPPPKAARGGRAKSTAQTAPFVATPVGAAVGKVAPVKELEAAPFTLSENAIAAPAASTETSDSISVSLPAALDVYRGREIGTTVTVVNEGDAPVTLLLRPETIRFKVTGPAGPVSCGSTPPIASPIRELYSRLGAKRRASLSLLLTTMCPADTFDEPGIYRVTPELDTTNASARSIGLSTWDGTATGKSPMLLRVRTARRLPETPTRPTLD